MKDPTRPPVTLRRADARDYRLVARLLGRAFAADPVANYLLKPNKLETAFGAFFRHAVLPHREAWLAGDDGVALWTPPGKWSTSGLRLLAMGPSLLSAVGLSRVVRNARLAQRVEEKHPLTPHWYLFAIGVDPEKQGRGVGSSLLRGVLARCDEEKAPAYLEASTEANSRLYARHGFRVTEKFTMAEGAPPVWLMWREPQS